MHGLSLGGFSLVGSWILLCIRRPARLGSSASHWLQLFSIASMCHFCRLASNTVCYRVDFPRPISSSYHGAAQKHVVGWRGPRILDLLKAAAGERRHAYLELNCMRAPPHTGQRDEMHFQAVQQATPAPSSGSSITLPHLSHIRPSIFNYAVGSLIVTIYPQMQATGGWHLVHPTSILTESSPRMDCVNTMREQHVREKMTQLSSERVLRA